MNRFKFGLIFLCLVYCSPLYSQSLEDLLAEPFKLYQEGEYAQAKDGFEKVLSTHQNNSFILYNLGLTEYKLGSIGLALGHWNLALNTNPSLKEASQAIEYAISQLNPPPEVSDPEGMVDFTQQVVLPHVPVHVLFLLVLIASFMTWKLALRDFLARRQALKMGEPAPLGSLSAGSWAVLFLLAVGLLSMKIIDDSKTRAIVISKKAEAKISPSADQVTLFDIPEGTRVEVLGQNDDWFKIQSPKLKMGWVPKQDLFVFMGGK